MKGVINAYSVWLLVFLLMPVVVLLSLLTGQVSVSFGDVFAADSVGFQVFWQLRMPHVVMTLLAGALLGVTGAATQALFRNPLADPGLMGVSSGAALAAVLVMVLGGGVVSSSALIWFTSLSAFCGGVLTTLCVAWLARAVLNGSVMGMLLLGIAVNAIAVAAMGALKFVADAMTLRQVVFWLMGGFADVTWLKVAVLALLAFPVVAAMMALSSSLNLLLLGEGQARLLGVNVSALQTRIVLVAAAGVAGVVSVGGLIGYVSLIIPHMVRMWVGPDHRQLVPLSALYGAVFLTFADVCARVLVSPAQLPLGIVTTLIGGPCFLLMVISYYRGRFNA